ncbi:amidohydrolase [Novosphingobium sp.]|uniref:amidohydrolase n=1 Tax=Novosphingobium sp. TaxID=1874826 RepID=UPI0038B880A4
MTRTRIHLSTAAVLAMLATPLAARPAPAPASAPADLVLLHGHVIPMTGADVRAEALAVRGGRIVAVGSDAQITALRGKATQVIDLAGRTLLPGFIDAHGHITGVAQSLGLADLSPPPVGAVGDIAGLQAALRVQAKAVADGWIFGRGYDDAELAEHRHPTRQELDAVSADRPVAIIHASGHLAVLNTKALELTGQLHGAKDPAGGVIRREADGVTANGVVEEAALWQVMAGAPRPTPAQALAQLRTAQDIYASNGLTTAQDGATSPEGWALLQGAAQAGALVLDVDALPLLNAKWPALDQLPFNQPYDHRLRVAGVKLLLDGSPQGRTAWLSHPYFVPPPGREHDYAGYPQFTDDALRGKLAEASGHKWQVYAHVNGDAAIQQYIDAIGWVAQHGPAPLVRSIAIHAQTARTDQLAAMKALDIEPSFFASHTFFWGDWHRDKVLGPQRADHISPQREAFDAGLHPTIHSDAPVTPPNVIRLIWSATTRRTRSGDILGPAERVSAYEALQEVTSNAAYEIHEEASKGTLEVGKLADLVILNGDPLTLPIEQLMTLQVSATLKEGKVIFADGTSKR